MKFLTFAILILTCIGCEKYCNEDYLAGEALQIPVDLSAYSVSEVAYIYVWNVNDGDTVNLSLRSYLWPSGNGEYWLTDNQTTGPYSSDLDGSSLYFYFPISDTSYQMLDSMTAIVIKKSKGQVDDECYKDHANVRIDVVSFQHAGVTKGKGDVVVLRR